MLIKSKFIRCLFWLILLSTKFLYAQEVTTDRVLLGTFLYNEHIFNYTFKQNKQGISSIQFLLVTNDHSSDISASKGFFEGLKKTFKDNADKWVITNDTTQYNQQISEADSLISISILNFKDANSIVKTLSHKLDSTLLNAPDSLKTKREDIKLLLKELNSYYASNKNIYEKEPVHPLNPGFTEKHIERFLTKDLNEYKIFYENEDNNVSKLAQQLFYEINTRLKYDNNEPATAYLQLKSEMIPIYKRSPDGNTDSLVTEMKVRDIQFEFENGTIKNIYAKFNLLGVNSEMGNFEFRNNKPISIAGKFDPGRLLKHNIYFYPNKQLGSKELKDFLKLKNDLSNESIYFQLDDLMKYILILENYKEDYSPSDCVVLLSPQQPLIELKKQLRSKILNIKAFTDFNGVNKDAPNGLIQFEGTVGVNVWTDRYQSLLLWRNKHVYQGYFTKFELTGLLSKIEENNKYFNLKANDLDADSITKGIKAFRIRPVDLLRYQNYGININLNVYKLNIPQAKLNFQINGRAGLIRTGVTDSLTYSSASNSITKLPVGNPRLITSSSYAWAMLLDFNPESRYGFTLGYTKSYINILSSDISYLYRGNKQINCYTLNGYVSTNANSKIFFRWIFNAQQSNSKINYNQVQLGYIVDIFKLNDGK